MSLNPRGRLIVAGLANVYAGARVASAFGVSPWTGAAVQLAAMRIAQDLAERGKPRGVLLDVLMLPGELVDRTLEDRDLIDQPEGV